MAIRARQKRLTVKLIDSAQPPVDKACGEGLMPDAVDLLERLGVDTNGLERMPFRGIRYIEGDTVAEGRFPARPGLGLRRLELHKALAATAEASGVDLCWGTVASGFTASGVLTGAGEIAPRWIVAADGMRSPLRKAAGLDGRPAKRERFGRRRHYLREPWTDHVEVHWADGCEAYVTPVAPALVGVAILWSGVRRPWDEMIAAFPALEEKVRDTPAGSRERGAGPLEQRTLAVTRGNLALVGDASGYVDAITGEGMAIGLQHAFAVVDAILEEDLRKYTRAHRRIGFLPLTMTRALLEIAERPAMRKRFLWTLAENPCLFDRLLAIMTRSTPAYRLGFGNAVRLLRALI